MNITVTRAFWWAGSVQAAGSTLEVDARHGAEFIACGKAQLAQGETHAPAQPMTTESVPALLKPRKHKEQSNAG